MKYLVFLLIISAPLNAMSTSELLAQEKKLRDEVDSFLEEMNFRAANKAITAAEKSLDQLKKEYEDMQEELLDINYKMDCKVDETLINPGARNAYANLLKRKEELEKESLQLFNLIQKKEL